MLDLMANLEMTSTYVFFLLFASVFCQWNNSESINITSIFNETSTTIGENGTDQTTSFPITTSTTTTTAIVTTTVKLSAITTITASTTENNLPSKPSHRWFLIVPLVILVVAISFGVFHYYRRQTPYRRFIQNWRSGDDDRDNIILQLEEPEITNGQWPSRISFT